MLNAFSKVENDFYGHVWEELCRNYISANGADGVMYQMAHRWWGSYYNGEQQQHLPAELDVVAESFDGNHFFIGECKWQEHIDAKEELLRLQTIAEGLPFANGHQVHFALFLRKTPKHPEAGRIYYPDEVLSME